MILKITLILALLFSNVLFAKNNDNSNLILNNNGLGFYFKNIPLNYNLNITSSDQDYITTNTDVYFFEKDTQKYFSISEQNVLKKNKYYKLIPLNIINKSILKGNYLKICYKEDCTYISKYLIEQKYNQISIKVEYSEKEYYSIYFSLTSPQYISNVKLSVVSKNLIFSFERPDLFYVPLNIEIFSISYV